MGRGGGKSTVIYEDQVGRGVYQEFLGFTRTKGRASMQAERDKGSRPFDRHQG